MKKLVGAALALALVAGAATVAIGAPGGGAFHVQMAEADWLEGKGPSPDFYFVAAMRMTTDTGLITVGAVGKGSCTSSKTKHFRVMMCSASGKGYELGVDDFEFDPALRSARMHLETKKYTHDAVWEGDGLAPAVGQGAYASECGVEVAAGGARWAPAKGTVFDREFDTNKARDGFSFLDIYTAAYAFTDCVRQEGDRIIVEKTFKLPLG